MTNKYYYNDILVRTSKTHEYHYAVIREVEKGIAVLGCSKSYEGAVANRNSNIAYQVEHLNFIEKLHDARINGKTGFYAKSGRRETYYKTRDYDKSEYHQDLENQIKETRERIENYYNTTKIVEIEKR